MIKIESKDNNLYKETKKLSDRKGRSKTSKFVIEGFRLIEEAYKANLDIEYIFLSEKSVQNYDHYIRTYNNNTTNVYLLSDILLKDLCKTEKPQGIVAVASIKNLDLNLDGDFYLLCDKLQDPGNLGTIIRTAHAAGVSGIILTKGTVDVYNEKTIRASMGSIFHVPIVIDNDNTILKNLLSKGFEILATSLEGDKNFFEEDLSGKIIISVGNEGNGVSSEIYSLSTKKVKIPMPGGAESLNVAIAASIILYEKVRQNQ